MKEEREKELTSFWPFFPKFAKSEGASCCNSVSEIQRLWTCARPLYLTKYRFPFHRPITTQSKTILEINVPVKWYSTNLKNLNRSKNPHLCQHPKQILSHLTHCARLNPSSFSHKNYTAKHQVEHHATVGWNKKDDSIFCSLFPNSIFS